MNENGKEEVKLDEKKEVSLEDRLKKISEDLGKVKAQIKQTEDQMVQTQRQLQARKDALLSMGLELQGQEKLLKDLLGIKDVKAPIEAQVVEAKKEEPKKEEKAAAPEAKK